MTSRRTTMTSTQPQDVTTTTNRHLVRGVVRRLVPSLPDDVWARIALHGNYETACRVVQHVVADKPPKDSSSKSSSSSSNHRKDDDDENDSGPCCWEFVFRTLFHRQLFAAVLVLPPSFSSSSPSGDCDYDYESEIRYRRCLLSNLIAGGHSCPTRGGPPPPPSSSSSSSSPWGSSECTTQTRWQHRRNLVGASSSGLSFVPIRDLLARPRFGSAPTGSDHHDNNDSDDNDDPPMIPFECDMFVLLSPVSDEYLLLNPEDGTVLHGQHLSIANNNNNNVVQVTGSAPSSPSATSCNAADVRVLLAPHHQRSVVGGRHNDDNEEEEGDVTYLGIEGKHVVVGEIGIGSSAKSHGNYGGRMHRHHHFPTVISTVVASGRQWTREDRDVPGIDRSVVTEVLSWERSYYYDVAANVSETHLESSSTPSHPFRPFGDPKVCCIRDDFFAMDLDAANRHLLVVPIVGDDDGGGNEVGYPNNHDLAGDVADEEEAAARFGGEGPRRRDDGRGRAAAARVPPDDPSHACGSRFLHVLPLVPVSDDGDNDGGDNSSLNEPTGNNNKYFPRPAAVVDCGAGITCVSSSGNVWAVTTVSNTLLWYEHGRLVHAHPIVNGVREALRRSCPTPATRSSTSPAPPPKRSSEREQLLLQSVSQGTAVEAIRFATFAGPDRAGFVTLSHGESYGSTLLLWKRSSSMSNLNVNGPYHVDAVVRLPLKASRIPKVHFDGRRVIVSGEDHLGHILLVYYVQSPDDPDDDGGSAAQGPIGGGCGGGGSGGMIVSGTLRFARRIRHAAMGGLHEHDSLHVSANERYIVVNTRRGHELMPVSRRRSTPTDGLFIVDSETAL